MLQLKRTPFHERTSKLCLPQNWRRWAGHIVAGSYDLHLDREYWAIRDAVAMIDVSPLMKYMIEGPDAARLLHKLTPRDVHKMAVGQVGYTGWCDEDGKMLDDGTVSRLGENLFRLTSAEPSLRWLTMNAVGMDVTITEVTEQVAALSLQGPKSRTVLNLVCGKPLDKLKYFRVMQNTLAGKPVTISRTGYTGDLGYEIWIDVADALHVWDALMAAGHDYGIVPCGILAMDMARVEAGLFMIDVDYTAANHAWIEGQKSTPLEMGLDWAVQLDKPGYFVGRRALEREKREGSAWKLMGFEVDWESMERLYAAAGLPPQIPGLAVRGSLPLMLGGNQVGYASTSTWSPVLKKYIALVHLQRPHYEPGTQLNMEITVEHKRLHAMGRVVKLPFYEPEWKKK
ncbi:aminomethyltransferase family protein [Lysobacter niastensis]|uniref:Aminomethyl transferase family protein n=1 Tax=Lysobacter niastensis TaxID=380629 RepID=A0ABS0B5H1_9GAMM|nr:aminomethyltransferase family protein [Lysobacter niastensis]MBF6024085.1 aminomethyl transferase family protein [Lysobacter niastensis]